MWTDEATRGICASCKHENDCIYAAGDSQPPAECAQFELAIGNAGLCATCEKRKTCVVPKPEGGVWRCEEYG